jgi:uncharacterized caspase-like protein
MSIQHPSRLFLSHASDDAATALKLCQLLEARGLRCWMAPRDIPAGGEYRDEIMRGIESCDGMLVLVSRASVASPFVGNEVERAFAKGRRLYPVFLEEVKLPRRLEFTLASFQSIWAWKMSLEQAADELVASVRQQPVPARPAPPPSSFPRRRALALGGVVLALALAAILWPRDRAPAGRERGGAGADAPPASAGGPLRYHAIVIGVNAYQPQAGEGWTPLRTARQDAEALASVLERDYGFQVQRVLDGDATAKGIMVALDSLSRMTDGDAVLVFFAGHGFYDEAQDEGYWIPVDAGKSRDGRPAREDWLWNAVITRMIEVSPARHVLVIADACYSGSLFRGDPAGEAGPDPLWYQRASVPASRFLITSGGNEPVLDGAGAHSVFAGELLRFLESSGKPMFSAPEIALGIREKVAQLTGQMVRSGPLAVASHGGGEFVFTRRGASPPAVEAGAVIATSSAPAELQLRSALTLARQGATNAAQRLVSAVTAGSASDPLAQAVAGYLDRGQRQQRSENLRALIQELERNASPTNLARGHAYADFARPRILACLGPGAAAGLDPAAATLYQLTLRTQLEASGAARVIERERLEEILEELHLSAAGLTDARAGAAVGKLLPASLLLLGDVMPDGDGETVYLRLVDTETSQVIGSFEAQRAGDASLPETCRPLTSNLVARMREARPLQARVLERSGNRLVAGLGSFHGGRPGQVLDLRERVVRTVQGVDDAREVTVGTGTIASLGDVVCDIDAAWSGEAPADAAVLWARERMP